MSFNAQAISPFAQPQVVAPGITLVFDLQVYDPITGRTYFRGQSAQFASAYQAYEFLQRIPQCVQTDVAYPYYGARVVYVYRGSGCAPNLCPCAY